MMIQVINFHELRLSLKAQVFTLGIFYGIMVKILDNTNQNKRMNIVTG